MEFLLDKHLQEKHADSALFVGEQQNGSGVGVAGGGGGRRNSEQMKREHEASPSGAGPLAKKSALR